MKTIVWDVDDVLNNLMKDWFETFWLLKNSNCNLRYENITMNPPHEILKIKKDEYLSSLDEFRSQYYENLEPNKEVYKWFEKNGESFKHFALTSTPVRTSPKSALWVMKNYGKWIRGYFLLPSYRKGENIKEYHKDKGEFLKELNCVDFFIDDSPKNVEFVKNGGINALLFPAPWNNSKLTIEKIFKEMDK